VGTTNSSRSSSSRYLAS